MNHPSPKRITLAIPPVPKPVTVAPAPWRNKGGRRQNEIMFR